MPEYYGYKAAEQPNFGKSISNVAELFVAAEAKRKEKRDVEQKSLDESRKKINEIEQNSNQSQSELIGSGANKTRSYILELERMRKSGQITGAEFNRRMTNVNDSWDNYAFVTKNMNERLTENLARQQEGLASSNEIFLARIQSELMNTKNKDIMVGEDGNMYMVDKNDPSKPISLRSGGNIDNIVDNKIDVPTLVQSAVKNFGEFSKESGTTTESGARLQEEYDAAKYDIIHSIVDKDNPRGVVSILMDNAGADYAQYYNKGQKEQLLNDAVTRQEALKGPMTSDQKAKFRSDYEKNNMIEYVADDNGSYQPVITDAMVKEAESYVDRTIEMQVGRTTTQDEPYRSSGGGGGGEEDKTKISDYDRKVAKKVIDAWATNNWRGMSALTNNKYYFKWENGGISVYTGDPYSYKKKKDEYNKLTREERSKKGIKEPEEPKKVRESIKSADGLSDFFFGETESARNKWSKAINQARSNNSTNTTETETPKVKPGAADDIY